MILGGPVRTKTPPGETVTGTPTPGQTGSRPAATPRCEKSDLPLDQCGDTCCRPDLAHALDGRDFIPIRCVGTWHKAEYPGFCSCGCATRFELGGEIVFAVLNPDDHDRGWCLLEHTRDAVAGSFC